MRWAALWLGLLTACGLQAGVDWHLVFFLPYNNDLAEHSAFIQAELGRLHTDDRVAITLLVDTPEEPVTFLHYRGGRAPSTDTTRWNSCQSGEALAAFLEWGRTRVPRAKRRAFFQLGHGGGLNRMLLDQHPDSTWMSTVQFAQILGAHTSKYDPFDALMLQQCSKATLTELVELAPMAEWLAASPLPIGAPNYYYAQLVQGLQHRRYKRPKALLRACMTQDRATMSQVWALVHGPSLLSWVDQVERSLAQAPVAPQDLTALPRIIYGGTDYWDLRTWMNLHVEDLTPDQRVPWRAVFAQGVDTWVRPGTTRPVSEMCGVVVARRTPADQDFALATRAPLLWSVLP